MKKKIFSDSIDGWLNEFFQIIHSNFLLFSLFLYFSLLFVVWLSRKHRFFYNENISVQVSQLVEENLAKSMMVF